MKFDIELPKWAKWLTQDADGAWAVHEREPYQKGNTWRYSGRREYIAFSFTWIEDWQSQLYEIYYE
ncbi:hypothetical protein KAR91_62260 [Candidatus Pacearchaeota archaeon]|nr:hypothetical protein [Candidatus Pacearchaeota archaeon]